MCGDLNGQNKKKVDKKLTCHSSYNAPGYLQMYSCPGENRNNIIYQFNKLTPRCIRI
jgi:hypothetical protein